MGIRLACHKWTFGECDVAEAARLARALGFEFMDLGSSTGMDPTYIAEHVDEESNRYLKIQEETGVKFIDAVPQLKPSFSNNHPDKNQLESNRRIVARFMEFGANIGLEGVTLSGGRYWPGEHPRDSFLRGAEELVWAVAKGNELGLEIRIEPHVRGVTWTPALAREMIDTVAGLSLTIDHSHFTFCDLPYEQISPLHAYGSHWHARQARPGELQCRWEDGEIDFKRIVGDLKSRGYEGVICLEYGHSSWMQLDRVDCVRETVKLRDHLTELLDD